MTTATVTPPMQAKAERLAEMIPTFSRGRSKANGQAFYVIPSSTKPETVVHYASHLGCTCASFRHRGVCCHQQACLLVVQRAEAPRIAEVQANRVEFGQCVSKNCIAAAVSKARRCRECHRRLVDQLGV